MLLAPNNDEPKHYGGHRIAKAWGTMLHRMTWDHAVTLTFRPDDPQTDRSAMRHFERWVQVLQSHARKEIGYFATIHGGIDKHRHIHAVLAGTKALDIESLDLSWHGHTRINVYDPTRGYTYYITKHMVHDDVEYALHFPEWMRRARHQKKSQNAIAPPRGGDGGGEKKKKKRAL